MSNRSARFAGVLAAGVAISSGVLAIVPLPATVPPLARSASSRITSFATDHPEFGPLRDGRKDATEIKFPHSKHLDKSVKDWKGVDRSLQCTDCHLPDSDRAFMLPVTFEAHCQACHAIGQIEVAEGVVKPVPTPHGNESEISAVVDAQVHQWMASELAKPQPTTDATKPADEPKPGSARRGRGGGGGEAPKKAALPKFNSPEGVAGFFVEQRDRVFKDLAKNTKCGYCHNIEKPEAKGSPFKVGNPRIPDQWLTKSVFSHRAHEMVSCQSCHAVEASATSADINLPGIKSCRECHSPSSSTNGAGDSCVLCHVYHQKSALPANGRLQPGDLLGRSR